MAKLKTVYICSECGREFPKWNGRCDGCGAWNSLEEEVVDIARSGNVAKSGGLKIKTLSEITSDGEFRFDTGTGELNRVLGGGLVKGSLVLLSGDPGIGKSTLLLQICGFLGKKYKVLYVSGEESERQVKLRGERLGVVSDRLFIASCTDCELVCDAIKRNKPDIAIVDSIQTMEIGNLPNAAGSITQVRECTGLIMKTAKTEEIPVFIVGHVNKDGGIAGPKVLEHIVDTVLYFEGDKQLSYRILRAAKNRFGSTNEIGVFEMRDKGLYEVTNPSATLLSGRPTGVSGISILSTMEGTRPIMAEIQALVSKTGFGTPRRVANGFDYNRLCLILAVLEKRTGFFFGSYDVYINVIGGLRIDEPGADLAIAAALYSGLCDIAVPEDMAAFGEIGLGGELRAVSGVHERIKEAARLGFKTVVIPKAALKTLDKGESYGGIRIIGASNLRQAFKAILGTATNNEKEEKGNTEKQN